MTIKFMSNIWLEKKCSVYNPIDCLNVNGYSRTHKQNDDIERIHSGSFVKCLMAITCCIWISSFNLLLQSSATVEPGDLVYLFSPKV